MKAIVYIRVSTEEQGKSGLGLEAQRQKALAYCQLHDHEVVAVVEDAGASGKSLNRPGMQRVLQAVDHGEVEVVVVAKLDRATRSVRDLGELLERFNRSKVALASVSEHLDTSTAAGKAFLDMLGVFAEFETNIRKERQLEGIAKAKAAGVYKGRKPTLDVEQAKALKAEGLGATEIAKRLGCSRDSVYRVLGA